MKMGRAAMWANWRTLAVALVALGVFAGCGKTGTSESGETHFVNCNSDADCANVAGTHTCDGGVCGDPTNDGSTPPGNTPACDGGCGGADCATPGTCTLAAACALIGCDTYLFDDNACVRPGCDDDAGCPDDERCTAIWLSNHYQCGQQGASCVCQAGLGLFPLNICSPVSQAGPRGQWQKLVVTESALGDSTKRTINPDGSISIEQHSLETGATVPSTAQLNVDDLDELTRLVNGPILRLELANPKDCPITKENDAIVDLFLGDSSDSPTLSKNVAGCLSPPDDSVAFESLMQVVRRY
jgi:hypothetical protein